MPIIKVTDYNGNKSMVDIGFYNLVFKNDLVKIGSRVEEVKRANYSEVYGMVSISCYTQQGYAEERYGQTFYLYKRPLKNWIKYLIVRITKRYR